MTTRIIKGNLYVKIGGCVLLNNDELIKFINMDDYKKTQGILKHLEHTKGCWKIGASADLKLSFNSNGLSVGIPFKLVLYIVKPIIIAKEISDIKTKIIERTLNLTLEDFNIKSIIYRDDYYWMESDSKKLKFLKALLDEFFSDIKIVNCVFNACEHLNGKQEEKTKQYNFMINKLNSKFDKELEFFNRDNLFHSAVACCGAEELCKLILKHTLKGNLTDGEDDENVNKFSVN